MLSVTIGAVIWIRWTPQPLIQTVPSATAHQIISSRVSGLEEKESLTTGLSNQNVQGANIDTVAQIEPSKPSIRSRLDLNRASVGELESLPGIGAVLAERVIAFRESVGQFQKIDDLRGVKGIGAKKMERLKSFVMVSVNPLHTTPQKL